MKDLTLGLTPPRVSPPGRVRRQVMHAIVDGTRSCELIIAMTAWLKSMSSHYDPIAGVRVMVCVVTRIIPGRGEERRVRPVRLESKSA